jgi:putative NADH-flavin reductase
MPSSVRLIPGGTPDLYNLQIKGTRAIIDGAKKVGVKRVLFVGGSGSLEVQSGVQGVDLPGFPEQYTAISSDTQSCCKACFHV